MQSLCVFCAMYEHVHSSYTEAKMAKSKRDNVFLKGA